MSKLEDIVAFSDIEIRAQAQPYKGSAFDVEVSAVSLRFAENGIPKAILKVTLGESPQQSGGIVTAKAHARAKDLERRDRITVRAKIKGHQTPKKLWEKGGEFIIFAGYLSRPAYTMGTSAASLILEVDHWLSDLATTHKLSYIMAAGSAAHCTRPVLCDSFTGGKVSFDGTKVTYAPEAPKNIWQTTKNLFSFLAAKDRMEAKIIRDLDLNDVEFVQNTLALQALGLMDKGKTMALAISDDYEGLQERVREGLTSMIAARESGASFWETLLTLSKEFMFSVIPTIYTATCAPVIKTYSGQFSRGDYRFIEASEYDQIQVGGQVRALPIRGLGLYSSCVWFTLDTRGLSQQKYQSNPTLVGYWDIAKDHPGNAEVRAGQLMMMETPGWMKNAGAAFSPYTPANTPRYEAIRTMANSKAGGTPPEKEEPNVKEDRVTDKNDPKKIGNRLAQVMLSDITWRNRTGSINGRLRFDIAPGTPVVLEIVGKNVPYYRSGGDNTLHAHVYQVDIDIDAIAPRASTTLHLSHMRTDAEEQDFKSIVVTEHPLYGQAWDGTSLLDGG